MAEPASRQIDSILNKRRGKVPFSSVTQSCPTFCDPVDCSTPGFPVHHQLPEPAQTHDHRVSDAIQLSHPLSSHSPPAFSFAQHQGLFQWVGSSYQVAKVWKLQHQSFQWIFRTDFVYDWLVWSPCYPRDSQESSLTPQFKNINSSMITFFMVQLSHLYMTTGKTIVLTRQTFVSKVLFLLFNKLPSFVIAFLPKSKHLLMSWLQSLSAIWDDADEPTLYVS